MTRGSAAALVVIGSIAGAGAFWLNSEGERANRIIRDLPNSTYETCLEANADLRQLDANSGQIDCSEYRE